jgi:hypothetical protein
MEKHGVIHKDYKNGWSHTKIYNKGYLMNSYRYPTIDREFNSALLNYDNLHLCGGWHFEDKSDETLAVLRVLDGLKPMGIKSYWEDRTEGMHELEAVVKNSPKNVKYLLRKEDRAVVGHGVFDLIVASNELFSKLFNIGALIWDYGEFFKDKLSDQLLHAILIHIESFKDKKVSDFLKYDYGNPDSSLDLITTGLILGYPIETTASLILRDYY